MDLLKNIHLKIQDLVVNRKIFKVRKKTQGIPFFITVCKLNHDSFKM